MEFVLILYIFTLNHIYIIINLIFISGQLTGFADEVLSTLFAVKPELCNKKFELKVNDVRFVGHPTLLQSKGAREDCASHILVNIVFALHAQASHSIGKKSVIFNYYFFSLYFVLCL